MATQNTRAPRPVTNGDRVAQHFSGLRDGLRWVAECPDEAFVFAFPFAAAMFVSLRHRLPFPEHMLLCELGGLAGTAALNAYVGWKAQPAPPAVLRGVKLWTWSRHSSPGLSPSA